jgi:formylglycine-generating enzyme required for sulfatase activity
VRPALWLASLLVALAPPAGALQVQYVAVRSAGNPADDTGLGAVAYDYAISRYEITNSQYAEFLNAVATPTDPNGLYKSNTGISYPPVPIGFLQVYLVDPGFESRPVSGLSFWDAARFANWLHNGQPVGEQNGSTTEDGAYTLTAPGIMDNSVVRDPGATFFVPSTDEWYKAAFYDPALPGYYDYPTGTDVPTVCAVPSPQANRANCGLAVGGVTDVGAYPASASPFGTFDQGGNLREWVEEIAGAAREARGGFWASSQSELSNAGVTGYDASFGVSSVGLRIARTVPEPGGPFLAATGALVLAAARRRGAPRG